MSHQWVTFDEATSDSRNARPCWNCGVVPDAQTHTGGEAAIPDEGDIGVCFSCGFVGIYVLEGGLRAPEEKELREAMEEPQVRQAVFFVQYGRMCKALGLPLIP